MAGGKHDPSAWLTKAEDIEDIPAPARQLLENYAGVPAHEVLPHVLRLRDAAFVLYPWPCIGQLRFLRLSLSSYPSYPRILSSLKQDPSTTLLDVGCCFGQDMRKLVLDGVPPTQIVGLDLVPKFNELGKELFRDGNKLEFQFYARDVFDDTANWEPLQKRFDFLHITSFLHIWNWDGQIKAAERLVKLVRSKPGSLLVGSGLGTTVSGEFPNLEGTGTNFRQSDESFARFWKEVGERTGTNWEVRSEVKKAPASKQNEGQKWADPNMGILSFEVEML